MDNLTAREADVLALVYSARVATTAQISTAVWGARNAAARKTLTELHRRGLIRMQRVAVQDACDWKLRSAEVSGVSGHAVTITERGIRALVRNGVLGEEEYRPARERRPRTGSLDHMVLVTGARVHATAGTEGRVEWETRWEGRVLRRDGKQHIPDGVMVAEGQRWAVEVDRGVLHTPTLVERWERLLGADDAESDPPDRWPQGYLWLMTAATEAVLRNRVSRLRREAAGQLDRLRWLERIRWVVDSYDGALWTWRHWLRPWILGNRPSPAEAMGWAVVGKLGELPLPMVVTLGDLQAWLRLVRMAESKTRRIAVVVRDELEAEDLEYVLARRAPLTAALYLVAGESAEGTPLTGITRYPGETSWRTVSLAEFAG